MKRFILTLLLCSSAIGQETVVTADAATIASLKAKIEAAKAAMQ